MELPRQATCILVGHVDIESIWVESRRTIAAQKKKVSVFMWSCHLIRNLMSTHLNLLDTTCQTTSFASSVLGAFPTVIHEGRVTLRP
jgi:hypothetical protein